MQDQHAIHVTSEIIRSFPANLRNEVRNLSITLTGEVTEKNDKIKSGIIIKTKGRLLVYGEVSSVHFLEKVISAIREKADGRIVQSQMTARRG